MANQYITPKIDLDNIVSDIKTIADAAYHQGFNDGIEAVKAAAATVSMPNGVKHNGANGNGAIDISDLDPESIIGGLYYFVKNHTGLKGTDAVRKFKQESGKDFHEVYGTTVLHRLKKKGFLENKDGKWY